MKNIVNKWAEGAKKHGGLGNAMNDQVDRWTKDLDQKLDKPSDIWTGKVRSSETEQQPTGDLVNDQQNIPELNVQVEFVPANQSNTIVSIQPYLNTSIFSLNSSFFA